MCIKRDALLGVSFLRSIVFLADLEVALGVVAGGTHLRRAGANDDVAAVPTLPHLHLTLGKHLRHLHIVQQGTVALLMVLLDGGHQTEAVGQLGKAFGLGGLGEVLVHVRPFVVLALGGGLQIHQ